MRRQIAVTALLGLLAAFSAAAGDHYGPVMPQESLSQIAYKLRPDKTRLGTYQTLLALYRANPGAFVDGDINRLKPGSILHVPGAGEIRAIAKSEAYRIFHDHLKKSTDMVAREPVNSHGSNENNKGNERHAIATPAARADVGGEITDLRRLAGRRSVNPGAEVLMPAPPDPNRGSSLQAVVPHVAWKQYEKAPVPDRWRLLDTLGLMKERWYDPYQQNTLKGDKPFWGRDHFFVVSVISDTIYEPRRLPAPVGAQATSNSGAVDIFGGGTQSLFNQNLIVSLVYLKGDTTFRPPDVEYHLTPVFNLNYTVVDEARALRIDPRDGRIRRDNYIGIQELFADYHLRNVSDRYDFDSIRFGIQPFSADFRGFLFQDNQLALRLFGNRDNNRWQYNLAWVRRLEKDTNSGLNAIGRAPRDDDTFFANLYRQDWPVPGFTSQGILAHNINREDKQKFFNTNGFLERPESFGTEKPRRYHVSYLGYNGDGHFGRVNLTASAYFATGHESRGVFSDAARSIRAGFGAAELSLDQDWIRWRLSALWASGENDPYDNQANGFDAIFENPIFAGADTSFYIRQAVPLIGGGIVTLSTRNGVLSNLRSSKEHGQSNFTNPGTQLVGAGTDLDLSPTLRVSANLNYLRFDDSAVLEVARNQGGIDREIGWDLSAAMIYRPLFIQNIVFRLSAARLLPGSGYKQLFPGESPYSVFANLILAY